MINSSLRQLCTKSQYFNNSFSKKYTKLTSKKKVPLLNCRCVLLIIAPNVSARRFISGSTNLHVLDLRDMPSPRGLPIIGTTLSLILAGGYTRLHEYIDRKHQELGPIFRNTVGPVTAVFLSDAEEMRKVFAKEGKYPYHIKPEAWLVYNKKHNYSRGLFFMDGEEWLKNRRIMNNLLMKGDLTWVESSCHLADSIFLERISQFENQIVPDLEQELYKWSMDVTVAILIGSSTYRECHKDLEKQVEELAEKVRQIFETTVKLQLISAELAESYSLGRWKRFEQSVSEALEASKRLLQEIRMNFVSPDGLLDKMNQENMTQDVIDRIIVDLMLGAGDTTSNTLSWALYSLAKNQDIQEDSRQQFKTEQKTPLVRNIIRETLRLYPSAPFLTRILPDSLSICGYLVPANTLIVLSIYTSGKNEKYFKNSGDFLPNRWQRDNLSDFPKTMASLPFAMGSRSCIGRKIAETSLQDTLEKLILTYRVELDNAKDVTEVLRMILKPSEPLRLRFRKIQ